jgi:hypothetical protein
LLCFVLLCIRLSLLIPPAAQLEMRVNEMSDQRATARRQKPVLLLKPSQAVVQAYFFKFP